MIARMISFAVTPARALAAYVDFHRLRLHLRQALRRQHVFHFAGADAECERAERAVRRGVAVAADDGAARLRDSEFRPDHVHDALIPAVHVEQIDAELLAVFRERLELCGGVRIEHRQGAVFRRNRVVHHRKCQFWPAHLAPMGLQSGKGLWRGGFMNQMPVDVNERRLAGLLVDDVRFPDFFVQRARRHSVMFPAD